MNSNLIQNDRVKDKKIKILLKVFYAFDGAKNAYNMILNVCDLV